MLRKADLIRHLDRRLSPTLQDAMQRTEALKRKSPQPIIPINPKINQSGAGAELGRGAFREWISCDHQGKEKKNRQPSPYLFGGCVERRSKVCIWSARCSPKEKKVEEDDVEVWFRKFLVF
jgi:hypothetical protein